MKSHIDFIEISWKFQMDFIDISWKYHVDLVEISYRFHRDFVEISYGFHWDFIDISYRFHWDFIEISYGFHWDFMEISGKGRSQNFSGDPKYSLKISGNCLRNEIHEKNSRSDFFGVRNNVVTWWKGYISAVLIVIPSRLHARRREDFTALAIRQHTKINVSRLEHIVRGEDGVPKI